MTTPYVIEKTSRGISTESGVDSRSSVDEMPFDSKLLQMNQIKYLQSLRKNYTTQLMQEAGILGRQNGASNKPYERFKYVANYLFVAV